MKFPKFKTIVLVPLALFALFYVVGAIIYAQRSVAEVEALTAPSKPLEIAIFGASGTAGDGILKAALAADEIETIHVVTRRETPRMVLGTESGKVHVITHMDYLDYTDIQEKIAQVDAVYWAIGISALGVDEATYGLIHVDFPREFVKAWNSVSNKPNRTFHFISSSDISEESNAMWQREKIRAEKTLFALAENTNLKVIAYRPDYIGPTREQAHLGQKLLYQFFKPVGAAVKARQIGQSMIAVTLLEEEFANGAKLPTPEVLRYSDAYERLATCKHTNLRICQQAE